MTSISAQSDGRATQSGLGRFTCRKVFWRKSKTVKRSLGNGLLFGLDKSKRTLTPAADPMRGSSASAKAASHLRGGRLSMKVSSEMVFVFGQVRACYSTSVPLTLAGVLLYEIYWAPAVE